MKVMIIWRISQFSMRTVWIWLMKKEFRYRIWAWCLGIGIRWPIQWATKWYSIIITTRVSTRWVFNKTRPKSWIKEFLVVQMSRPMLTGIPSINRIQWDLKIGCGSPLLLRSPLIIPRGWASPTFSAIMTTTSYWGDLINSPLHSTKLLQMRDQSMPRDLIWPRQHHTCTISSIMTKLEMIKIGEVLGRST